MSLWAVLMRSWLRVLIAAGFAGAAIFAILSLAPPQYLATTELQLPTSDDPQSRAQAIDHLTSEKVVRRLVADLNLASQAAALDASRPLRSIFEWPEGPSATQDQNAARALEALRRSLTVTPGSTSDRIAIHVLARAPDLPARIADRLAQLYIADERPSGAASQGQSPQDPEVARLSEHLEAVEAEIARLTSDGASASGSERAADAIQDLVEAVAQAERERADAETRARTARALLDKGEVENMAELQTSPVLHELIAERVRIEVQKNVAERSMPADDPRVIALRTRLSELRWQMFREATAIAESLDAQAQNARARESEMRARLERSRAEAARTSGEPAPAADGDSQHEQALAARAARLAALHSEAANTRARLANAQARLASRDVPVTIAPPHPRPQQVAPAQETAIPAFPNKGQLALLTTVAILMLGFAAVIARTLLQQAVRRTSAGQALEDLPAADRDLAPSAPSRSPTSEGSAPSADPAAMGDPGPFAVLGSIGEAARQLAARATRQRGYRTLLACDGLEGAQEARELISALTEGERRCVMVNWSRSGPGIAPHFELASRPGINDLLDGRAGFDDVITRLPESEAHFIASGSAPGEPEAAINADWVNLVLDALDEAYDHILVVAELDEARSLFEATQGRFDAGLVMSNCRGQGATINAGPGVFLGFEVTEIYITHIDLAQRQTAARRFRRNRGLAAA